jgi:GrpB-like predicted nucleotidyltransferase (UPF0157 family)
MPAPFAVELLPHDPAWAEAAAAEGETLAALLGPCLRAVHHIGSTAISAICAKPVLDLLPVVTDLPTLDTHQAALEAAGFRWNGEYGLAGRRYCTKDDPVTGRRRVQAHFYAVGDPAIERHLAFRDYLNAHRAIALDYADDKQRCRTLHPDNSHAYSDCKHAWIRRVEAAALAWMRSGRSPGHL